MIYTIPAASPLHYVTYVRIYSATPEAVVVGYTPGYLGVVVSPAGTVVYGTGYVYPAYVAGDVWYGYPATYGYGAGFGLGTATGFAFGFAAGALWGSASPYWGPYWGYDGHYVNWGHVDVNQVNVYGRWGEGTVTHASGWNGWTDTSWSGSHVSGFNPYTGAHGQAGRGRGVRLEHRRLCRGSAGLLRQPSTGVAAAGRAGITGNVDTGDYQAGRQVAGVNEQTGRIGAAQTTVTGNVQTGDRSVDSKGSWSIPAPIPAWPGTTATSMPAMTATSTSTPMTAGRSTIPAAGSRCSATTTSCAGSTASAGGARPGRATAGQLPTAADGSMAGVAASPPPALRTDFEDLSRRIGPPVGRSAASNSSWRAPQGLRAWRFPPCNSVSKSLEAALFSSQLPREATAFTHRSATPTTGL